jgi:hypothetical protein
MTTTAVKMPMSRINFRVVILLAVVLLPVGYVLWQFLQPDVIHYRSYDKIDLYWLSNFEMDQRAATDADIPAERRVYDGKRVLLQGEMYQPDAFQGPVKNFELVYSITKCCMVGIPKKQHLIKAQVMDGKLANAYPSQAVEVLGTLHAGIVRNKETDEILSVYRLEVESVRQLTGDWGAILWIGGAIGAVLLLGGIGWLLTRRRSAGQAR